VLNFFFCVCNWFVSLALLLLLHRLSSHRLELIQLDDEFVEILLTKREEEEEEEEEANLILDEIDNEDDSVFLKIKFFVYLERRSSRIMLPYQAEEEGHGNANYVN
jgi:predicted AAA+ superfamily ATPase